MLHVYLYFCRSRRTSSSVVLVDFKVLVSKRPVITVSTVKGVCDYMHVESSSAEPSRFPGGPPYIDTKSVYPVNLAVVCDVFTLLVLCPIAVVMARTPTSSPASITTATTTPGNTKRQLHAIASWSPFGERDASLQRLTASPEVEVS